MDYQNSIKVSVILVVDDTMKILRRTLDALVYQTFQEIEIIVVDNSLNAGINQILVEYGNNFPQMLKLYVNDSKMKRAKCINFAIDKANGDYVLICKKDVLFRYNSVLRLYENAEGYDIVIGNYQEYYDECLHVKGAIEKQTKEIKTVDLVKKGLVNNTRLIKSSLLKDVGEFPEEITCSDEAMFLILNSWSKKTLYLHSPVYYYFGNSDDFCDIKKEDILNDIEVFEWALQHIDSIYYDNMIYYIAKWCKDRLKNNYAYADIVTKWLKAMWIDVEKNQSVNKQKSLFSYLNSFVNLPDEPFTNKVYINGFDSKQEEVDLSVWKYDIYHDGVEIVILNEENCSIDENAIVYEAYKLQKYEFVAGYFALKKIYENGGIYLNTRIKVDTFMNLLKYLPVFFCYEDDKNYSDWIFGAKQGNDVIESILKTYDSKGFYDEKFEPLAERIRNILFVEYKIPIKAQTNLFTYPIALLGPEASVIENFGYEKIHFCHYNLETNTNYNDEYCVVKRTTIDSVISMLNKNNKLLEDKVIRGKKDDELLKKDNLKYKKDAELLKKDNLKHKKALKKVEDEKEGLLNENSVLKKREARIVKERNRLSKENDRISLENNRLFYEMYDLRDENSRLRDENENLQKYIDALLDSTSWKVTKGLRTLGQMFRIRH